MTITPVATSSTAGKELIARLRNRFQLAGHTCQETVGEILADIQSHGDPALLKYINKFDAPTLALAQLRVSTAELANSFSLVDADFQATLDLAIARIKEFHEREKKGSWIVTRPDGTITGRLVNPVDSAGLYVPGGQGGKTPLVSSVLMNGIPAGIAGVGRRVMLTPPNALGEVNPALLVAAQKIGIDEIYKAGSAWGIAALAYGTATIPAVDVIVGPGNQYVTEAKRQLSGRVRIDMIAGPSEVLIVADDGATPTYIAADMLAQAEHDPQALAILLTTSATIAHQVVVELKKQLTTLSRKDIATHALKERGVILIADHLDEAIILANQLAAEHLELMIRDPFPWLTKIRHAGAIFLGDHSPEATGDYVAGPNHVLPTMGTARFSSALGVETFLKQSSLISYSRSALTADARHIIALAELEGLTAHANSVAIRVQTPAPDPR